MGMFDDLLADDMIHAFADTFGESVLYTKKSGATRTITAVVDRFPPQIGEGGYVSPSLIITVPNDATHGILSSEVNYGGDTITVAARIGETAKAFHLRRSADGQADQDHGMVRIELF